MRIFLSTVGLAVVTGASLGATGCNPLATSPPGASPASSASPEGAISATKTQYTEALKAAKRWQSNATLTRVYRQYSGTLEPTEPPPLVFSFSSLADPSQAFLVETRGDNRRERRQAKPPFELMMQPVDADGWQIDPEQALKTAEENGGKQFREQHLAGYKILQQLAKPGNSPLQWYFRYDAGDGTRQRLELYIDAASGAVGPVKSGEL